MIKTQKTGIIINLTSDDLKEEAKKHPFQVTLDDFNISYEDRDSADVIKYTILGHEGVVLAGQTFKDVEKDPMQPVWDNSKKVTDRVLAEEQDAYDRLSIFAKFWHWWRRW